MAEGEKITAKDVIVDDLFGNTTASAEKALPVVLDLKEGFQQILRVQKDILTVSLKSAKTLQDVAKINQTLKDSKVARDGLNKAEAAELKILQEKEKLKQQQLKTDKAQIDLDKKKATEAKKIAREQDKLNGAYAKGVKRLNELKKVLKELEFTGRTNGKVYKGLREEFDKLEPVVTKAEQSVREFGRGVGNYRESVRLALGQTGLFDRGLARLGQSLITLRKNQDKTASSTKNFTQLLKLAAIGLAVLAISALVAALKKGAELSQTLADGFLVAEKAATAFSAAVGSGENVIKASIAAGEYVKVLRETRIETQKLRLELQKAALDEQDFNEIAADGTIGFEERNKALEEAIKNGKERARLEVAIAKEQLTAANKELQAAEVAAGVGKASLDIRDRQLEAQLNYNEALDKEGDLERQNAERIREQRVNQAIAEIELLRSKKLSAKAQEQILTKQLADEKIQLEERKKIAKELLAEQKATTNEEIRIFKEKIGVEFNGNQLISTQDAKLLKQRLESIKTLEGKGLGEAALAELAKVIKQAQDNQIAFGETVKKQEEEEISRKKKIAEIEREIAKITREDAAADLSINVEREKILTERLNEKLLTGKGSLNGKLLKQRKAYNKQIDEDEKALLAQREENLKLAAEAEKKKIDETVNDEQIRAEEIKKIEAQLQIDLENLRRDADNAAVDSAKARAEEEKAIRIAQLKVIQEQGSAIADSFNDALDKRNEKLKEGLDREIEQREKNIERQQELADKGLDNQLARELAKRDQAELRKQEIERREQRRKEAIQLAEAYLAAYIAELEQPDSNPQTAAFKALADVLLAKGVGEGLAQAFAEGGEDIQGPGTGTSDSINAKLSAGESVITATGTKEAPGLATAWNAGKLDDWIFDKYRIDNRKIEDRRRPTDNDIVSRMLLKEMSGLRRDIQNRPVSDIDIDKLGNLIKKTYRNGVSDIVKLKTNPRI